MVVIFSPLKKTLFRAEGVARREMRVLEHFCSLKRIWTSSILFDAKRGPLKTSVSKKTARSEDISHVNLIVAWNRFEKSTKLLISCLLEVHTEKMSSMNLFQMIGL